MDAPKDFFGNEIEAGDTIVYPTSLGHASVMNVGTVVAITTVAKRYGENREITKLKVSKERNSGPYQACKGSPVTIEMLDRVVIYRKGGV